MDKISNGIFTLCKDAVSFLYQLQLTSYKLSSIICNLLTIIYFTITLRVVPSLNLMMFKPFCKELVA